MKKRIEITQDLRTGDKGQFMNEMAEELSSARPWIRKEMETMNRCQEIEEKIKDFIYDFSPLMLTVVLLLSIIANLYTWLYVLPRQTEYVREVCSPFILSEEEINARYGGGNE